MNAEWRKKNRKANRKENNIELSGVNDSWEDEKKEEKWAKTSKITSIYRNKVCQTDYRFVHNFKTIEKYSESQFMRFSMQSCDIFAKRSRIYGKQIFIECYEWTFLNNHVCWPHHYLYFIPKTQFNCHFSLRSMCRRTQLPLQLFFYGLLLIEKVNSIWEIFMLNLHRLISSTPMCKMTNFIKTQNLNSVCTQNANRNL